MALGLAHIHTHAHLHISTHISTSAHLHIWQAAANLAAWRKRLEAWKAKKYDLDELYAQLYSYKESGFYIGCSTFFVTEAEISQARAVGIQVIRQLGDQAIRQSGNQAIRQ